MWKSQFLTVLFVAVTLASCVTGEDKKSVSISNIVENPDEYMGQSVRLYGYATYEFENLNLWKNERAERAFRCDKAIGIELLDEQDRVRINRKYVPVTGTIEPLCGPEVYADDDKICISTGHCGDVVVRITEMET